MNYIVNSFQVPNFLVDELMPKMSPNALKCYLLIVRKTIGWAKEYDAISASQFCKFTGIKKDNTVFKALKELEEMELLERISKIGHPTFYKVVTVYKKQDFKLDKTTHTKKRGTPKKEAPTKIGVHKTHINSLKRVNREKDVLKTSFSGYLGREIKVAKDLLKIEKISSLKNQKLEILTTSKKTNKKLKAELKKEDLESLLEVANV
ncbi:replication protein [Sulfurospirillum sp. 1612]|uniref:replication protein n=1 Tax=Sulfurospirillum sp. 1612 TaxID=3094835 RepID=UPI002F93D0CF